MSHRSYAIVGPILCSALLLGVSAAKAQKAPAASELLPQCEELLRTLKPSGDNDTFVPTLAGNTAGVIPRPWRISLI